MRLFCVFYVRNDRHFKWHVVRYSANIVVNAGLKVLVVGLAYQYEVCLHYIYPIRKVSVFYPFEQTNHSFFFEKHIKVCLF